MSSLRTSMAFTALVLLSHVGAGVTHAAIIGALEAPAGFASQISNVQGWVYTTTPGAELIQPFDVLVNGEKIMEVPCCSARGDVKGDDPDIPLQTGFSAVTNWAREAGGDPITVEVVVRDTQGGEKILTSTDLEVYALASFPFVTDLTWAEVAGPVGGAEHVEAPNGIPASVVSRCALSNTGTFTPGGAELVCTNIELLNSNAFLFDVCDQVRFSWDKASQGFKQTSGCEELPRWTENGDGTATDNTTGLVWELKTDDGSVHDKDNPYLWSDTGTAPDGSVFSSFLGTLNGGVSADGFSTTGCFAGQCDWRLPTIEELVGILDTSIPACVPSCTTIPGEIGVSPYWSSSTDAGSASDAWHLSYKSTTPGTTEKEHDFLARAVRGGQ